MGTILKREVLAGFAVCICMTAATALAQQVQSMGAAGGSATGGSGIPVGPLMAYPGVNFVAGHDDNLFYSNLNKRGSSLTVLSPYVTLEGKPGPHKFDLTFQVDDGRYYNSTADNYTDYGLLGRGELVFSGRAGLKLRAEARHGHDPRGSTDRAVTGSPDEYDNSGVDGVFAYGAPGAQGRIEVDAGYYKRDYTNNRATTAASDHSTSQLGGTFYWRVMPRTELLFNAGQRWINYDQSTSTQDSTETRLYVGAKWEATAKTTGYVKVGQLKKDFKTAGQPSDSFGSWDLGVRWSPLTYSVVDLLSSKQTNESTGVGNAIVSSIYSATWTHAWNSRLRSTALARYQTDDFSGATRADKTEAYGLRLDYEFRRWLKFGGAYTYTNRNSNVNTVEYNRNLWLLTVGATL
jgi:hypothetical protein